MSNGERIAQLYYEIGGDTTSLEASLARIENQIQSTGSTGGLSKETDKSEKGISKIEHGMRAIALLSAHSVPKGMEQFSFHSFRSLQHIASVTEMLGNGVKIATVLGAAIAGWNLGRLIADVSGLDKKLESFYDKHKKNPFMSWAFNLGKQQDFSEEDIKKGGESRLSRFLREISKGKRPHDMEWDSIASKTPRERENFLADEAKKVIDFKREQQYKEEDKADAARTTRFSHAASFTGGEAGSMAMNMQKAVYESAGKEKQTAAERRQLEKMNEQLEVMKRIEINLQKQGVVLR